MLFLQFEKLIIIFLKKKSNFNRKDQRYVKKPYVKTTYANFNFINESLNFSK